jgi:hypothetical protein
MHLNAEKDDEVVEEERDESVPDETKVLEDLSEEGWLGETTLLPPGGAIDYKHPVFKDPLARGSELLGYLVISMPVHVDGACGKWCRVKIHRAVMSKSPQRPPRSPSSTPTAKVLGGIKAKARTRRRDGILSPSLAEKTKSAGMTHSRSASDVPPSHASAQSSLNNSLKSESSHSSSGSAEFGAVWGWCKFVDGGHAYFNVPRKGRVDHPPENLTSGPLFTPNSKLKKRQATDAKNGRSEAFDFTEFEKVKSSKATSHGGKSPRPGAKSSRTGEKTRPTSPMRRATSPAKNGSKKKISVPKGAPPASSPVPEVWHECTDGEGNVYFFNERTRESQW